MMDVVLIFFCLWSLWAPGRPPDPPAPTRCAKYFLPYQFSNFSDDPSFYEEAYRRASAMKKSVMPERNGNQIRCAVISHHLFVADLIADCFLRISAEMSPRSIIIVGPNHKSLGTAEIAVSALQWKTPFGFIDPDPESVRDLNRSGVAKTDEDAFFQEHSIGALTAFAKYSFPRSKLTAIVVRPEVDTLRSGRLARWLSGQLNKGALMIASLDFSHYKKSTEAQREDSLTYRIISGLDAEKYADAFVDSRPTLFALLRVCRMNQAYDIELVHHTNSGLLAGKPDVPCTSYMNLFFRNR